MLETPVAIAEDKLSHFIFWFCCVVDIAKANLTLCQYTCQQLELGITNDFIRFNLMMQLVFDQFAIFCLVDECDGR